MDILPGASNIAEYLPLIKDKKVCVVSNQTGIIPDIKYQLLSDKSAKLKLNKREKRAIKMASKSDGLDECREFVRYVHIVDTLKSLGVDIVCIMSPEHGFRGTADAGEKVSNSIDEKTGIEVRSLYGNKLSDEELSILAKLPEVISWSKYHIHWHAVITSNVSSGKETSSALDVKNSISIPASAESSFACCI